MYDTQWDTRDNDAHIHPHSQEKSTTHLNDKPITKIKNTLFFEENLFRNILKKKNLSIKRQWELQPNNIEYETKKHHTCISSIHTCTTF